FTFHIFVNFGFLVFIYRKFSFQTAICDHFSSYVNVHIFTFEMITFTCTYVNRTRVRVQVLNTAIFMKNMHMLA
ncbi:hypothetical protein KSS87_017477, partial [Heliosperma pusillum]